MNHVAVLVPFLGFELDVLPIHGYGFATRSFGSCTALEELVLDFGVVPLLASNTFANIPSDCAVYVRDSLVDSCKSASYWSERASYIKKLSEYQGG